MKEQLDKLSKEFDHVGYAEKCAKKSSKREKMREIDIDILDICGQIHLMSLKKGYKIHSMVIPGTKNLILYFNKEEE